MVVALLALVPLAACDPYPPARRPGAAEVSVNVDADGSAYTQVFLDETRIRTTDELHAVGEGVGAALLPAADSLDTSVDPNGAGYPFAVVTASHAYRPGPTATVQIDARQAVAWLLAHGNTSVDLHIRLPVDDYESSLEPASVDKGSPFWSSITDASRAPVGTVVLTPNPWLSLAAAGSAGACVAALVLALVALLRRRRPPRRAVWFAVAALVCSIVLLPLAVRAADDVGVSGALHGAALHATATAAPWSLMLFALSIAVLAVAGSRRARPSAVAND